MIERIRKIVEGHPAVQALAECNTKSLTVTGLAGSLAPFVVAALRDRRQSQVIFIGTGSESAMRMRDDLTLILGIEHVQFFSGTSPSRDRQPVAQGVSDIQALCSLAEVRDAVIVTTPQGISLALPNISALRAMAVHLSKGEHLDFQLLVDRLRECGFEQKDYVESHGEFAVRGGILDVFAVTGDHPIRVEFGGDEIESIREFDPISQRSIKGLSEVAIIPDPLAGPTIGMAPQHTSSLLDYANENALVIIDEPELMRVILEVNPNANASDFLPYHTLTELLELFSCISITSIPSRTHAAIDFAARAQPSFNGSIASLQRDLSALQSDGFSIYVTCDSHAELLRLIDLLGSMPRVYSDADPEAPRALNIGEVQFSLDALHGGFVLPDVHLAVYTEHQVFNRIKRRDQKRPTKFKGFTSRELQQLQKGDYVVHADFGIGRYEGLRRIRVGQAEQEVVKVIYDAHDTLFVNLNYVEKLQKYSSKEGHTPLLSRLGSSDWERLRLRAKKRIKDIARELILLYARRKKAQGIAFSPDTPWQKELEASFMYEDTYDQAKATLDVKRDMEAPNPMDRLICGDVGFGKTEVAVRAAFKAVLDGKQVALLVPTTILAMQHFNTFRDRLVRYGVKLEVMSRFQSRKEQVEIIAGLREGGVDIVIGTHRILSEDITIKNLGLLIIDEEHRFGVTSKERLRRMRIEVDTLSLTATPIPRTLHFSLMGARDLSIIATPPRNRLPIATEILQWDDEVIHDAVMRELQRGGQSYFVHDRVQTMEEVTKRLQGILPEVRLGMAHGQMPSRAIENVMMSFLEKKCDVLVATKIIESGLDIPNVNTIIINRADQFGMAELYQLRGRVGRSNVQAYSYLLTPPISVLSRSTLRRLQAIEEYNELGSGFNLAMRDLEIRGAGNLLGAEQSGFIENMGFETYTRVLEEAVEELRDSEFKELFMGNEGNRRRQPEVTVEADLDAYIPESYLRGDAERLAIYRRLYALTTPEQLEEVSGELHDRFGRFPTEIDNLFAMIRLRLIAASIGFRRISLKGILLEADFPPETDALFYESDSFQWMMSTLSRMNSKGTLLRQEGKALRLRIHLDSQVKPCDRLTEAFSIMNKFLLNRRSVS